MFLYRKTVDIKVKRSSNHFPKMIHVVPFLRNLYTDKGGIARSSSTTDVNAQNGEKIVWEISIAN